MTVSKNKKQFYDFLLLLFILFYCLYCKWWINEAGYSADSVGHGSSRWFELLVSPAVALQVTDDIRGDVDKDMWYGC